MYETWCETCLQEEIRQIEESLRRIFKKASRKEYIDWEDSTDEEDIIAEFVEHRNCKGRCRVRYVKKQEATLEVEKSDTEDEEKVLLTAIRRWSMDI